MKMSFFDPFDGIEHEVDIPNEICTRAFSGNDPEAMFEVAIFVEQNSDISMAVVQDLMLRAYDDGAGSERAGEWLSEYIDDDGKWDAWA